MDKITIMQLDKIESLLIAISMSLDIPMNDQGYPDFEALSKQLDEDDSSDDPNEEINTEFINESG